MTRLETVNVPHASDALLGGGHQPWITGNTDAGPDRGQPVFRQWPPAAIWLNGWLDVVRNQLLEPHRQLVTVGGDQSTHPRPGHRHVTDAGRATPAPGPIRLHSNGGVLPGRARPGPAHAPEQVAPPTDTAATPRSAGPRPPQQP